MELHYIQSLIERRSQIQFTFPLEKVHKVLILAPHPDDETVGCGGIISYFKNRNVEVHVVLFTNGEKGGRQKNIVEVRRAEFLEACNIIGVDYSHFLEYRDGELSNVTDQLAKSIEEIVDSIRPQYIFTPYIFDANSDHTTVTEAAMKIVIPESLLFMYEVWTPILNPDYYINITSFYEKKKNAIQCYKSQEKIYQLYDKSEIINRMRSVLSMHRHSVYMECFRQYKL